MIKDQEYKFGDFTYQLINENHNVIHPEKEPQSFFKYYSIDKYKIDALLKNYIYTTHPYSFNDSIDSSELLLDFKNISKERYFSFFQRVVKPNELQNWDLEKIYNTDKNDSYSYIRNFFYQYFTRSLGLISLTTQPLNILMWSHYANEDGFVIELDKESLLEDIGKLNNDVKNYCLRPVQYVDNLVRIDMFQENFTTPDIPFLYMTTVKRTEWKYEDEWRLSIYKSTMDLPQSFLLPGSTDIKGENERKLYYSKTTLKSIILGKYFFNGRNCIQLNPDSSFTLKTTDFLDFVNHIFENYNDRIYMSGELESGNSFNRSVEKIELEKIDWNIFRIVPKGEGFYKK